MLLRAQHSESKDIVKPSCLLFSISSFCTLISILLICVCVQEREVDKFMHAFT